MKTKPRLLRITTVPISLKLLLHGQLQYFMLEGFEVLALSADGPEVKDLKAQGIRHQVIPMTRKITPFQDLVSLIKLVKVLLQFKPHIVHTHTPKAGLLGMIAAWICRVPIRMHTVAGLPLMESQGLKRGILKLTEKITYSCAHKVYPNSAGLSSFIENELNLSRKKSSIIGKGSSNGIDTVFFSPGESLKKEAQLILRKYQIPEDAIVFSFVGRIVKDKGIAEIIFAFKKLLASSATQSFYLLLVGPFEQDLDPLNEEDLQFVHEHPNVVVAGFQSDVRPWILASNIFVFPSYREGFPNVVMQACCLDVPCIVSDINGCNEIIVNKKTGLIVKPKDAEGLYLAMERLASNPDERVLFSQQARKHVVDNFSQQYVWRELKKTYLDMLKIG
jgi:glycosyltransferase involved in cell wall biosynthesis